MTSASHPDPALGIFETLLVIGGGPIELDAHMDRLAASLEALFGLALPAEALELIDERAAGINLGRLRLTATPAADGVAYDAVAREIDPRIFLPDWEHGPELLAQPLAGGLGFHKWADRSRLRDTPEDAVPLLVDNGDEVLEAGWANVFASFDGTLVTPRADGRILAGVTRAIAIAIASEAGIEVRERRLRRIQLLEADEVFLTGSVRGVAPARALDGEPLPQAGEISRLVGDALRQRWTPPAVAAVAPGRATAPPPGRPAR